MSIEVLCYGLLAMGLNKKLDIPAKIITLEQLRDNFINTISGIRPMQICFTKKRCRFVVSVLENITDMFCSEIVAVVVGFLLQFCKLQCYLKKNFK